MNATHGPLQPSRRVYPGDLISRFKAKLVADPSTGCIEWMGYVGPNGYGQIGHQYHLMLTHRLAYELDRGHIPEGMFVCHHCDNRRCCNPEHLFLGTHTDNMRDMFKKGRRPSQYGLKSSNGRLTSEQIDDIRGRYTPAPKRGRGHKSNAAELAREFGVTPQYISQVARGTWRNHG